MTPAEIIATLGMERHPEGGWYVQTFRDGNGGERGHSTAIYFLLEAGDRSHWHRVNDAVEVWHHYAGAPLRLSVSPDGQAVTHVILGREIGSGERPQHVVPAGHWQAAQTLGDWTLAGCTVAPGFLFDSFELAPPAWQPSEDEGQR